MYEIWLLLYPFTTILLKLSISLFLLKLALSRRLQWTIYATCTLYTATGLAFFLTGVLRCRPIQRAWDISYNGECIPQEQENAVIYTNAAIAAGTDWIFALLPMWMVWNTPLKRKVKVVICFLLGLGIL
jgi:hypothetical protein